MTGEYRNTMDDKGRLMIPPKMRESLGKDLVLTKSPAHSLWLFPRNEFEKLSERINCDALSALDSKARMLDLFLIAPAREVELDKTGRLSIPQTLRDYAEFELKKECVILGSRTHVEIISVERYEKLQEEFLQNASEIADAMSHERMRI